VENQARVTQSASLQRSVSSFSRSCGCIFRCRNIPCHPFFYLSEDRRLAPECETRSRAHPFPDGACARASSLKGSPRGWVSPLYWLRRTVPLLWQLHLKPKSKRPALWEFTLFVESRMFLSRSRPLAFLVGNLLIRTVPRFFEANIDDFFQKLESLENVPAVCRSFRLFEYPSFCREGVKRLFAPPSWSFFLCQ